MQIKSHQAESFINDIAKNKNIFAALVYGPESGLVSIYSKKIAKKIVDDLNDPFLVSNVSAKKIDEDKALLSDEFGSITMLGGRKLIIVEGENKITESLQLIFDKKTTISPPVGDNFILIAAGDLDKSSSLRKFAESSPYIAAIPCYEDDSMTITNVIRQKFKEHNLTFENGIVEILLNKFGKNRLIILNEIDKMAIYMGKETNVTIDILEQNIADIAEISTSQLVNSFADSNLKKSMFFLEKLFSEKTSAITIIRFLSAYFLKLALVQNNLENGSSLDIEMRNQNIFFKQQPIFKKHLNSWSTKAIKSILLRLQELEIKCKNGSYNAELLLAAFINSIITKRAK